jgi:hypothetical protein
MSLKAYVFFVATCPYVGPSISFHTRKRIEADHVRFFLVARHVVQMFALVCRSLFSYSFFLFFLFFFLSRALS